jgi:ankyrin repeat protein
MSQGPSDEASRVAGPGRQPGELADRQAALEVAIKAGDVERVRTLLDGNPELTAGSGQNGNTPLLLATYYHANEIVQMLVERGAPVSVFEAAAIGDARRVRQMLDDQPELILSFSHDGWTLLHLAAHFGQLAVAELLLARGAEVDVRSTNALANTPLHAALAGGHPAMARRLVDQGANVKAVDAGGYAPLHLASDQGDAEMVGLLLERGAHINARAEDGRSPQDLARAKGHAAVADQLDRQMSGSA